MCPQLPSITSPYSVHLPNRGIAYCTCIVRVLPSPVWQLCTRFVNTDDAVWQVQVPIIWQPIHMNYLAYNMHIFYPQTSRNGTVLEEINRIVLYNTTQIFGLSFSGEIPSFETVPLHIILSPLCTTTSPIITPPYSVHKYWYKISEDKLSVLWWTCKFYTFSPGFLAASENNLSCHLSIIC